MSTMTMSTLDVLRETYPGRALLSVAETAEVLLTNESALRARIRRGQIPTTLIGTTVRIPLIALAEFIDAGTTSPTQ